MYKTIIIIIIIIIIITIIVIIRHLIMERKIMRTIEVVIKRK